MIFQNVSLFAGLALCATMTAPFQVSAEQSFAVESPSLVLSDALGRPFYPADTHTFARPFAQTLTYSLGEPAEPRAAKSQFVISQITTLPTERLTTRQFDIAPRPVVSARIPAPRLSEAPIMETWSVGVFR